MKQEAAIRDQVWRSEDVSSQERGDDGHHPATTIPLGSKSIGFEDKSFSRRRGWWKRAKHTLLILPATRTWRNRFVALSVPSTRLRSLQSQPQNLLLMLQTWPAKDTDGASSGRLHSDDQVRPQNHQMRKLAVCVKNSCSLIFRSSLNLSLILFLCLSLCFWA